MGVLAEDITHVAARPGAPEHVADDLLCAGAPHQAREAIRERVGETIAEHLLGLVPARERARLERAHVRGGVGARLEQRGERRVLPGDPPRGEAVLQPVARLALPPPAAVPLQHLVNRERAELGDVEALCAEGALQDDAVGVGQLGALEVRASGREEGVMVPTTCGRTRHQS